MKPEKFTKQTRDAYRAVKELFTDDPSRRTVSLHQLAVECDREHDHEWTTRMQDQLPEFTRALWDAGIPVVPVNARCVRFFADTPIEEDAQAEKCCLLRGGGKKAAGLRRVMPDDLVLRAHLKTLISLGSGNIIGALADGRNGERLGLLPDNCSRDLLSAVTERLRRVLELPPQPEQLSLVDQVGQ